MTLVEVLETMKTLKYEVSDSKWKCKITYNTGTNDEIKFTFKLYEVD